MRYDGNNYLFVVTAANHYVLFPTKPEMEGRDASGLKDTNGKFIIQDIVKAANAGGGFVDYWFPKPGAQESSPKVSYATGFAPWGWIIGCSARFAAPRVPGPRGHGAAWAHRR